MRSDRYRLVNQLPLALRLKLIMAVSSALLAEGLRGQELEIAIYKASNSRVDDLSDTIDLTKFGI